ncbi:ATP-binding protein [Phormidesmis sp. 146-35]
MKYSLPRYQTRSEPFVQNILDRIESRYQNSQDASSGGAFIVALTGRYLAVSTPLARLHGYSSSEEMTATVEGIHCQYVNPCRWQEICARLAISGEVYALESEIKTRDGSTRWVRESFLNVIGKRSQVHYCEGIRRDITERKRSESLLTQRDRYLSALVEVQHRLLSDGNCYCSTEVATILGQTAQASRCCVFMNDRDQDDRAYAYQVAEWCAPEIATTFSAGPIRQRFYHDSVVPTLWENLSQGEHRMDLVKNLAESDQQLLCAFQVQAYLLLPLMSNGECWGFIGFINCVESVLWNQPEIHLLTSAALAISIAKERSEQKQTHLEAVIALQASEARLCSTLATKEALLRAIPDMIFRVSRTGVYLDFFPATGVSPIIPPDEFLGRGIFEVLPEQVATSLSQAIQQCIDTQVLQTCHYLLFVEDALRSYETRLVPYGEAEVLVIVRELHASETQSSLQFPSLVSVATQRLSESFARLKGRFTQAQTDSYGVLELLELYQQYSVDSEEIDEALRTIHLGDISESWVSLAAVEQFSFKDIQSTLRFLNTCAQAEREGLSQVDLNDCVDAILVILHDRLSRQYGTFKIHVSKTYPRLPEIQCYPKQLSQALVQIFINAIEAVTDPGRTTPPTIVLSGEVKPDRVRFCIADNGAGIDLQKQSQLFQPFVTTKSDHMGLGLTLSHQVIVNRHQGLLYFAPLGRGSQIVIDLPRV